MATTSSSSWGPTGHWIVSSKDEGASWTDHPVRSGPDPAQFTKVYYSVAYGGGVFVAVGAARIRWDGSGLSTQISPYAIALRNFVDPPTVWTQVQSQWVYTAPRNVRLSAIGIYTDDTRQILTSGVAWRCSEPNVATVSDAGVATFVADGTAIFTATYQDKSGSVSVSVPPDI